nr:protein-tyrosine-phosphatase [uncultured Chryseobacterium sp.]
MYPALLQTIERLKHQEIGEERKAVLRPLMAFIKQRFDEKKEISIQFICTHNSRRSIFSQVWAQIAGTYYHIPKLTCYSGGTEETAVFPKVMETLQKQGCQISQLSDGENPVYAVKYDESKHPVVGFSKKYNHLFNTDKNFAAVMTCSQADAGCPFIAGADQRIPVTFDDPKISDDTPEQTKVYNERSLQIAAEMLYVFSQIK